MKRHTAVSLSLRESHTRVKNAASCTLKKSGSREMGVGLLEKEHALRRGFHLNQLVSPWSSWEEIVRSFLIAKRDGLETLKVWTNPVLGESWEEEEEELNEEDLYNRKEEYEAEVPEGVKILTAAVDTQDNRFEIEVVGFLPQSILTRVM